MTGLSTISFVPGMSCVDKRQPETVGDRHDETLTNDTHDIMKSPQHKSNLHLYLKDLSCPMVLEKMNAALSYDFNNAASDLLFYYQSNPEMKQYTINRELKRMEYTLYLASGDLICDKATIARHAQNGGSDILWRAANQSLFAHAIEKLTSESGLIRPHFHASAIAKKCGFLVNVAEQHLSAQCELSLSVPSMASDGKLEIATISLAINFFPFQQRVEMHCANITPVPLTKTQIDGADKYAATSSLPQEKSAKLAVAMRVQQFKCALRDEREAAKSALKDEMDAVKRLYKMGFFTQNYDKNT